VIRLAVAALALAFLAPSSAPRVVSVQVGRADVAKGFVAADGRVVTVAHVLGPGDVLVDGRPATVVRRDERLDLAVLSAPGVEGPRVRFARTSDAVVRRAAARIDGGAWRRPVLELRAEAADGDSGRPVLSPDGRVVGVVFARSSRAGRTWAVDAEAIVRLLGL
jgi:S1-C subfamily serine protease